MKFLLIVPSSQHLNGVFTFCLTILKAMQDMPFECFYFVERDGIYYAELDKYGQRLEDLNIYFDWVILNEESEVFPLMKLNYGKSMFFVHSLMNPRFLPQSRFNEVFTFSERGREYLSQLGVKSHLISQPIWVENLPQQAGKGVLIFDIRNGEFYKQTIQMAASLIGLKVSTISAPVLDVMPLINDYDVVIGYGRCAIESMALGKPTIVYGINGGDGLVTEGNFDALKMTNFSGWSLRCLPPPAYLSPLDIIPHLLSAKELNTFAIQQRILSLNTAQLVLNYVLNCI